MYDVIIIGAGPAGLSAAIYAARAKYKVLVIEKEKIGGQITITGEIVNYPGVKKSSGTKLTDAMKHQAEAFGAEFKTDEVMGIEADNDIKIIKTLKGEYKTFGIIIAVGAQPRKLGFPGEKEFQGHGVAYCATCDGEFFTGKEVFVVGGGFAAVEEGIFLTKYAKHITMIVREDDFTCAKTVADQIKNYPMITVKFNTEVEEVKGNAILEYARFRDNALNETWEYNNAEGFGMFIFAGYVPNSGVFKELVDLDAQGYIITDINRKTNIDGIYAAGDVCVKNLRQVVTAVSDGATAATSLEKYVSALHEKLNIPEFERKEADLSSLSENEDEVLSPEIEEHTDSEKFITDEIRSKLKPIFDKLEDSVIVRVVTDNSSLSEEMEAFVREFDGINNKINVEVIDNNAKNDTIKGIEPNQILPVIDILKGDGKKTGIAFHAVPGGHEFNSFIMAIYNVAGPGQQISDDLKKQISQISRITDIKIMVSLSCTMCPEVVMASQKIAALNDKVSAEVFDLKHFQNIKEKYNIMSVPCMIINDEKTVFGKKSMETILEML